MSDKYENENLVQRALNEFLLPVMSDYAVGKLKKNFKGRWFLPIESAYENYDENNKGDKKANHRDNPESHHEYYRDYQGNEDSFIREVDITHWVYVMEHGEGKHLFSDLQILLEGVRKARNRTAHIGVDDFSKRQTQTDLYAIYESCVKMDPEGDEGENAGQIYEMMMEVAGIPGEKVDVHDKNQYIMEYDKLPYIPMNPPKRLSLHFDRKNVIGSGRLERYVSYGNYPDQIYSDCCEEFGWDETKAGDFDFLKPKPPLWAEHATREGYNPWFINKSNVNLPRDKFLKRTRHNHVGEDTIVEIDFNIKIRGPEYDDTRERRVVFVETTPDGETLHQYVFLGVYECDCYRTLDDGDVLAREFERISDVYPMPSDEETP